ncbi:hypothetical protein AHAS_Ahas11G0125100 [Arachis hypogaea]
METEPRFRKYVVIDHPFYYSLALPLFNPNAPYAFSLSLLHSNSVHHPFYFMHGGSVPAQQDGQEVPDPIPVINNYIREYPSVGLGMSIESPSTRSSDPFTIEPIETSAAASGQPSVVEQIFLSGIASVGNNSDYSPHSISKVIIISDDEDIKEIEIVDLTSEDDEDPEMDIEIMDLTSDSD